MGGAISEYSRSEALSERIQEGGALSESTGGWGFIREYRRVELYQGV